MDPGPDYISFIALEMHCSAQNMTENFWQIVLVKLLSNVMSQKVNIYMGIRSGPGYRVRSGF